MQATKKLAVAVTAMSIAAVGGGTAASAAQAQDEVLQATSTTFIAGGASGSCISGVASATFTAAGQATGPYAGSFTEATSANPATAIVSARIIPQISRTLTLSIPFTISSGSTAITGAVTNPAPYAGGSLLCYRSPFNPTNGLSVAANSATYTATTRTQGQPAHKVSGTAQVSAAFQGGRVTTPPNVTLLNFPSPLS
jgi:hypothetical protein